MYDCRMFIVQAADFLNECLMTTLLVLRGGAKCPMSGLLQNQGKQ
jgi:hypothetical protein